jgi:hypothetical protein
MMGFSSEYLGTTLSPELAAVERATEGLQRAINSELRHVYTMGPADFPTFPSRNNANPARNLRLLVVLWEGKSVEGLLSSLASKLGDSNSTTAPSAGDCAICTEHFSPKDMIMVDGCGHVTCKGCLQEYVSSRLGERVWPILCPICVAESGPGRKARRTPLIPPQIDRDWY